MHPYPVDQVKDNLDTKTRKRYILSPQIVSHIKLRTDKEKMYLRRSGNTKYDSTLFQIRTGRLVDTLTIRSDLICTSHKERDINTPSLGLEPEPCYNSEESPNTIPFFFLFFFENGQLYKEMHMERNTTRNEEPPINTGAKWLASRRSDYAQSYKYLDYGPSTCIAIAVATSAFCRNVWNFRHATLSGGKIQMWYVIR